MPDIQSAVRTALVDCMEIKRGEDVLVVTDPAKRAIAEAIVSMARELGAEVVLMEMSERESHGSEPPRPVAAAMLECDALIAPTSKSISHTEARKAACDNGARAATMPDITEEMLVRTMSADYKAVKRRSDAIAKLLTDGKEVHISSSQGTDVIFSIEGRDGLSDNGRLAEPGTFGNLPAGEGFIAPVEGRTNGRLVFDGSVWPLGRLKDPLTVDIEDGYARSFSGPEGERFRSILDGHGTEAFAVAELGIGTNEAAILTGNVLEDEKIIGTIHVAFGDNHSFGGTIRVSSHQDGILLEPTVDIDGTRLLEDGSLLL
jgi:leucyl aminopeptidase (aminopeptidase T)